MTTNCPHIHTHTINRPRLCVLQLAQRRERESSGAAAAAEQRLGEVSAERDSAVGHLQSSRGLIREFQAQLAAATAARDAALRKVQVWWDVCGDGREGERE
jgi:hypothetical protein